MHIIVTAVNYVGDAVLLDETSPSEFVSDDPKKLYLTSPQLAQELGVSRMCLYLWRKRGQGPDYIQAGVKTILYAREAVDRWVAQKAVNIEETMRDAALLRVPTREEIAAATRVRARRQAAKKASE